MTEPRPRPRAFRLDDASVAFDDRPAAAAPRAEVRTETAPIPDAPEPLDEGEREIEVAQAAGVAKPLATDVGDAAVDGARRPRLAGARPMGRRHRRGSVGQGARPWLARPRLRRAVPRRRRSASCRAKSWRCRRQRGVAELHAELAQAHAGDDRARARAAVAPPHRALRESARNRRGPRGDHRRR